MILIPLSTYEILLENVWSIVAVNLTNSISYSKKNQKKINNNVIYHSGSIMQSMKLN